MVLSGSFFNISMESLRRNNCPSLPTRALFSSHLMFASNALGVAETLVCQYFSAGYFSTNESQFADQFTRRFLNSKSFDQGFGS